LEKNEFNIPNHIQFISSSTDTLIFLKPTPQNEYQETYAAKDSTVLASQLMYDLIPLIT